MDRNALGLVACCDPPKVLDFQEEAFDEVSFTIKSEIAGHLCRCFSGWNNWHGILFHDGVSASVRKRTRATSTALKGSTRRHASSLATIFER
jgi:hypothetical protein